MYCDGMPDCDDAVAPPGVAPGPLTDWFTATLGAAAPLRFGRLAGGYSNLTFLVSDAAGECWVLRRPPLGHVLATAHDMGREGGIMAALAGTGVPVPAVLGHTSDPPVERGAVLRHVLRPRPGPAHPGRCGRAGRRGSDRVAYGLFDVLAPIHAVDLAATGLAGWPAPAPTPGASSAAGTGSSQEIRIRDLPLLDELYAELTARVPDQSGVSLIHGDYRLDNVILNPAGEPARRSAPCSTGSWPRWVIRWPIWAWPSPTGPSRTRRASCRPRRPMRRASRPAARSPRGTPNAPAGPAGDLGFYVALAHWKIACMAEGVYTRHRSGDMGTSGADMDLLRRQPGMRARAARRVLDGGLSASPPTRRRRPDD